MLELNKEYTYPMICEELGWAVSRGHSKEVQIKLIESAYKFYHPMNNKTHKPKKSYIFTECIGEIVYPKHGGSRENSGRNKVVDEDVQIVLTYFLMKAHNKNVCFHNDDGTEEIYFTNDIIARTFGIYRDMYNLNEEFMQDLNINAYDEIMNLLMSRKRTIDTKVKNLVDYSQGVITKCDKEVERHDELLERYVTYEKNFLKEHKLLHVGQVARLDMWNDMKGYIKTQFGDDFMYQEISKYKKIIYRPEELKQYTREEYLNAKRNINDYVVDSIIKSCEKRTGEIPMSDYQYVIDYCIRLERENGEY